MRDSVWRWFRRPDAWLVARAPGDVLPVLAAAEAYAVDRCGYAVGWVAYEAAPACDPVLRVRPQRDFPLAAFGLYPQAETVAPPRLGRAAAPIAWRPNQSRAAYVRALAAIRAYLAAGDTYQVNYTLRWLARGLCQPARLFARLCAAQGRCYAARIQAPPWEILSASPELFFTREAHRLTMRPMKGTAARGPEPRRDQAAARALRRSAKEQAENLMIVDMIRNDLGRIARPGSVRVPRLFALERYPTVWQMTSTVTCAAAAPLPELFQALFPCASITGAPKARTMEIIAALETTPRRIYTGTVGFLAPGGRAQFNVAIRTALVNTRSGRAVYGAGGGIVWDSQPEREYAEVEAKVLVLTQPAQAFELLETLLWRPGRGYYLLQRHLDRLAASAAHFAFPWQPPAVRAALRAAVAAKPAEPQRVRLTLAPDGVARALAVPLAAHPWPRRPRVGLARTPVASTNPFLYHKTTRRIVYETARAQRPDCDEVILWNERGELTEAATANLVLELDGHRYTPPVACGLLNGVRRAELLERGALRERVLTRADLERARRRWLVNSVRGWVPFCLSAM